MLSGDNKMTIQSPKIRAIGRIQTKFPDFYHQNQHITPQNNFAKKSGNNSSCLKKPVFMGNGIKNGWLAD